MKLLKNLENAWNIFIRTLTFLGKDKSLYAIPFISIASFVVVVGLFLLALLSAPHYPVALSAILFVIILYSVSTFLSASLVWMVYEVAQGKDATVASGMRRASHNLADIFVFSVVMLIINILASKLREKGQVGRIGASFIESIAGIAGKLALPAMIITDRSFIQAIKQLKDSVKTIPEIATYEIGVRPLAGLTMLAIIGLSVLIGMASLWTGVIIGLLLICSASIVFSLIDRIYYTLLYLTLIEKKKVKF